MSCVQVTDLLQHEPYRLAYKAAQDALAEKGVRPAAGGDPQANTIAACPELGQVTAMLAGWLKSDSDVGSRCHSIGAWSLGSLCRSDDQRQVHLSDLERPYTCRGVGECLLVVCSLQCALSFWTLGSPFVAVVASLPSF